LANVSAVGLPGGVLKRIESRRATLRSRGLERRHVVLLLLLGAASYFDGYDIGIKSMALTQIREGLDLTKASASAVFAVIYLGALPAMIITRRADRIGRRRLLIVSLLGYTTFSGLTALAPDAYWFTGLQFCQQMFLTAEIALVWTLAAEELPAKLRGWGFGLLGMNLSLGMGLAAVLWGGVFDPLGVSWRWLFVVSVPPMLFVAVLRRRLPESRRFETARAAGQLARDWREILRPPHRRWLGLVVAVVFLVYLPTQSVTFGVDFLQTDRGIDTSTANAMLLIAGLPAIPLMVIAGALSDRYGRRVVGCSLAAVAAIGSLGQFWLPGGALALLPWMTLGVVGGLGAFPVLATYGAELFPTSLRGLASSWTTAAGVAGRTASLGLAAVLLNLTASSGSSQSWTATALTVGPLSAIAIIALTFPDTHGRELEETSGELIGEQVAVAEQAVPVAPPIGR
jgi:MFS transporter, putative metabolite:H+ symporter